MTTTRAAEAEMVKRTIEAEDFDWIVAQHQKQIYRTLLFLVRDADAAEMLVQECFLRAFRSRRGFRGDCSIATWLTRIAINLARDYRRSRRWAFWRGLLHTERVNSIRALDSRHSPEQAVMNSETVNAVASAVDRLSERQRTVFMLRFVEEMPLESIAEAMGLEIGTVKAHLHRAMEAVRNVCANRK